MDQNNAKKPNRDPTVPQRVQRELGGAHFIRIRGVSEEIEILLWALVVALA